MRREDVEKLAGELASEACAARGLMLVDCSMRRSGGTWRLLVTIDKASGVSIEDCEAISHTLSEGLDEQDPIEDSYVLEVSSAGLSEPLRTDRDFERFVGRGIELELTAGWRQGRASLRGEPRKPDEVVGTLEAFDVSSLTVRTDKDQFRIGRGFVRRARPAVDFKGTGGAAESNEP